MSDDAWVYMLRCCDGSLYTGWTSDLDRLPVELALALPMPDRTAARREEARIKLLTRTRKLALIPQICDGSQSMT